MNRPGDELALFALSRRPRFSWAKTRVRIDELGSPTAVLHSLFTDHLLDDEFDAAMDGARQELMALNAAGAGVSTLFGADYPSHLRAVHDAPPVVYWRGRFEDRDADSVAIVGTRKPDGWGAHFAQELGERLAARDLPVVSGLARGIDSFAMRGSMAAGGRTVGVIGTGLNRSYPPENADLQESIAEHLLLTQFAPDTPPAQRNFPMRNVVMSGFASLTVIVQAGESSGTTHQAKAAVRHGHPLVLTERLVRTVSWAQDIVDAGYDATVVTTPGDAVSAIDDIHATRRAAAGAWGLGTLLTA